jgi:hypothetical protein
MAFPHSLDLNEPHVMVCLHDPSHEHILGAVETCVRREGIA